MTMKQAFGMYIDDVITKDYLDATLDARFAEQDLKIEKRISELDSKFETRLSQLDSKFEKRFNSTESDLRVLKWGQAFMVAAVLLPQLARLVS